MTHMVDHAYFNDLQHCVGSAATVCVIMFVSDISHEFIALQPEWKLADPICTFFFCLLVLFSTVNVLKDALRVVMEGEGG